MLVMLSKWWNRIFTAVCRCIPCYAAVLEYAVVGFLVYNRPIGEVWLPYSNLVLVEAERIEHSDRPDRRQEKGHTSGLSLFVRAVSK